MIKYYHNKETNGNPPDIEKEKKKMKKIIALVLSVVTAAMLFAGCGQTKEQTDLEYVKEKGKLVVGITDYAPMDYKANEADSEWIGFDADMAKAFAKEIGVDVEFVVIDWDQKASELSGKSIDCVWNGMTLSDEVKSAMDVSNAYCNNVQIAIVRAEDAEKYATEDAIKDARVAAESGSAGNAVAKEKGFNVTEVADQATALTEVASRTSDVAIIDSLMAGATVGEGTSYSNLTYTVKFGENDAEEFGVGFRKGSDLVEKLNEFFKKSYADGTMMQTAEKYGVQAAVIAQ